MYFKDGFHSKLSLNTTISLLLHWQKHFAGFGGVGRRVVVVVVVIIGRRVVVVVVVVLGLGVSGGMYVLRGVVA